MRLTLLLVLLLALSGCDRGSGATESGEPPTDVPAPSPTTGTASQPAAATIKVPLRIEGRRFVEADGEPFPWRGITAFRLAELTAHGREEEAVAYLDWAASQQLTVVRVLLMAHHLFQLSAEGGRAALPRLLDLAKARGIAVEIVTLADTVEAPKLDYDQHIRDVGRIALEKGNALIEIANEPGHQTQAPRVHQPAFLMRLAEGIPEPALVALGSMEYSEGFAAADYATTHVPRGDKEWDHVLAIADRAEVVAELQKPVVSDEPIGAGPEYRPGRRDNAPARFAAAAALTRFVGMEATFHYEGGLHARIPGKVEAECLAAWLEGLMLTDDLVLEGRFVQAADAKVGRADGARAAFARVAANRAAFLLIDPGPSASVKWAEEWKEVRRQGIAGVLLLIAERTGGI